MTKNSGFGKEFFSPVVGESIDDPDSNETPVGLDRVDGSTSAATDRSDRLPDRNQLSTGLGSTSAQDRAGDDPFHLVGVGDVGGSDDGRSGVLLTGGVDSIDRVGAGESDVAVSANSQVAGQRTGVEHGEEGNDSDGPPEPLHLSQSTPVISQPDSVVAVLNPEDEQFRIPLWLKGAGAFMVLLIAAAMAFAIFEPIQVLPRIRLAPGYALTAQDGTRVTSESVRGVVTLYSFAPTDCGSDCEEIEETMRNVRDRVATEIDMGETEFRLITVALDPVVDSTNLAVAAARSGADGETWRWVGGDSEAIRNVVGSGFRRFYETRDDGSIRFDPGFVLVDGSGVVRGEYRYQTLADDSDKLTSHMGVLAEEIRYANGATAVAYEAAHLFLCYP